MPIHCFLYVTVINDILKATLLDSIADYNIVDYHIPQPAASIHTISIVYKIYCIYFIEMPFPFLFASGLF